MSAKNKESAKREWTDDEVMDLIYLYEAEEFLWNVKHKQYQNRDEKMEKFEEFATKFGNCDGNEIQRKIHNLQNQVSHEMQKMKKLKSGDGSEDKYDCKWKFFPALQFVVPFFTPTKSTSNMVNTQESLAVVEDEPTEEEPTPQKRKRIPSNKKSQTPEDDILQEAIQIMKKPKDDFDCFGEYVAMELKNIKSDYYRGQLKSAIRKAIVQYSDMDEKSYWSSTSSSSTSSAIHTPSPSSIIATNDVPLLDGYDENQTTQQFYNSLYNMH